jgi:hypothetical protein
MVYGIQVVQPMVYIELIWLLVRTDTSVHVTIYRRSNILNPSIKNIKCENEKNRQQKLIYMKRYSKGIPTAELRVLYITWTYINIISE